MINKRLNHTMFWMHQDPDVGHTLVCLAGVGKNSTLEVVVLQWVLLNMSFSMPSVSIMSIKDQIGEIGRGSSSLSTVLIGYYDYLGTRSKKVTDQ